MFYHRSFLRVTVALLGAALSFCGGCALQQDLRMVDRRVSALHRQISEQATRVETLDAQVSSQQNTQSKTGNALRSKQADLGSLLNQIRDELKALTGRLEEIEYHATRRTEAWEKAETEMQNRLETVGNTLQSSLDRIVRLEQYLGLEPSEKLQKTSEGEKAATGSSGGTETADALYVRAKEQFDNGKYETAQKLFESYLKQYPKTEKADNAQFWIGEIYYREKWYEKAILEYQKVIETYPKGNKLRSALLKQGLAFLNLGDKDNARLILKELVRKHPDSSEAKIAGQRLEGF
jgi:tol-pal system protein YbgF